VVTTHHPMDAGFDLHAVYSSPRKAINKKKKLQEKGEYMPTIEQYDGDTGDNLKFVKL